MFISFYLESRTEPSVGKAQDYIGGNTAQIKRILGGGTPHILLGLVEQLGLGWGRHRTNFVDEGNNWGGDTAQH